jgi:hypothetical protein
MPYTPQSIHDLKKYLVAKTGKPGANFSIGRTQQISNGQRLFRGYHLGGDQLGPKDYSNVKARDRRGLSDARSAIDIKLPVRDLKKLVTYLRAEAEAGRLTDVREFLGPRQDGRAARYAKENNWQEELYPEGNSHEWHVHLSFFRDSTSPASDRDKVGILEGHFGPRDPDQEEPEPPPDDGPDNPPDEPEEPLPADPCQDVKDDLAAANQALLDLTTQLVDEREAHRATKERLAALAAEVDQLAPELLAIANRARAA